MFKALLTVQWKWTKGAALLATILAFAIPIASVQSSDPFRQEAGNMVFRMQSFGVAYAVLAAGIGLAFALFAWGSDHRGRHVYALSLPVERSRYAGMRFAAGLLFLVLPAIGVLVGSLVAVSIATIPAGLHAYPVSLTLRFMIASAVAFALFFAVAASTPKAAGAILGAITSLFVVAFLLSATSIEFNLLGHVADFVFSGLGPLSVFTGRWMLVDA